MDAAAIEEANRLRISMGMKPLPVPGAAPSEQQQGEPPADEDPEATFEGRQAQAYENYRKLQEAEAAKKKRDERAAAVKKAREQAQSRVQLEGKGLGDEDEDGDLDAKAWLKSQKKRQKKIEQLRRAEEEKERAAAAAARDHSASDLAGVKVGHDMSALLEDGEQVLTLKDTTVLENEDEGDELENVDLRAREKLSERLELKKKKPVYDPNDFDDTGERSILAQYDEDYGKKKKTFTLDAQGSTAELADILGADLNGVSKGDSLSLDVLTTSASDYLDVSEIKVKKPKKKKQKATRQRPADDDDDVLFPADGADGMVIDSEPIKPKKRKVADDAFNDDDDDLQASLAAQRRDALKKRKRIRPEDLARQLREEAQTTPEPEAATGGGGLVIDEISEFVGALQKRTDDDDGERRRRRPAQQPQAVTAMEQAESDDSDVEMANTVKEETEAHEDLTTIGVEEEKTVSKGMGAALALLRERGLVKESNGAELNERDRRHAQFLAERNRRLAKIEEDARRQRERDRASGLLDRMTQREKEEYARRQNTQREYQTSRVLNDMYQRDYTPNFEIKYTDDHGRNLDTKEAFKHLSHQFHGKGSGKGKTDKLLKKIEADKKREAASILDDSQNAGMGPSDQPKKRKEAGVRLA